MKKLVAVVCVLGIVAVCACTGAGKAKPSKDNIKVGFVYIGSIYDEGYTQAHDRGRLALEAMGIKCAYIENVPETAECEKAIRNLIAQGCNVIYTNAFGHMEWTLKVARAFPHVYFGHCTGNKLAENVSTFYGKIYQARYLSGIAAGYKTKANKIGYVAAHPIPQVIRGLNAFALGVQSVNPDAVVEVVWTGAWYDPVIERRGAVELLEGGCDVIAKHEDSTAVLAAAEEWGAFAIGSNTPSPGVAPHAYLTAPLFHWEVFYVDDVKSIIDGTWRSRAYWEGFSNGTVSLDELTSNNDPRTAAAIDEARAKIVSGQMDPFTGPLSDQGNIIRVLPGVKMTDGDIWDMDWLVKGVSEIMLN